MIKGINRQIKGKINQAMRLILERNRNVWILTGIFTAIAASLVSYDLHNEQSSVRISAELLNEFYEMDEVKANQVFYKKKLSINGKILSMQKDQQGKYLIVLETNSDRKLKVLMEKSEETKLDQLNTGNYLEVTGLCHGVITGIFIAKGEILDENVNIESSIAKSKKLLSLIK